MRQVDYRRERLRQGAERALAEYADMPSWKRQVLARFLVESPSGWHTHVHRALPNNPSGQPDALLIGPQGVFAVLLREGEPPSETFASAIRFAGDLFLGARVRERRISEAVVRPVLILPQEYRAEIRSIGDHLTVHAGELDRILERGERRLDKRDARVLAEHLESKNQDYIARKPEDAPDNTGAHDSSDELSTWVRSNKIGSTARLPALSSRG